MHLALPVGKARYTFDRFLCGESDQIITKKLSFQTKIFFARELVTKNNLRRIGNARHARHYAEHVVRVGINTDLSSGNTGNSVGRKDKLKGGIVDSGEVARAAWVMLLRAQGKGIHVDASVGSTGVVLEGLDNVEVRSLSLGDSVLSVELQLGSDNRVLTPAVHVEGSLSKHIGAGIGNIGSVVGATSNSAEHIVSASVIDVGTALEGSARGNKTVKGASHLEDTSTNEGTGTRNGILTTKDVDSRGEGINGVSVVKRLRSKDLVKGIAADQRTAIIDVGIGLNNPDEFLARVVEVNLDLVGRRSDRLITSVLELLNEVLVRVGRHLSALISVEEDEINVDGGSNEGLLVSLGDRDRSTGGSNVSNSPQALTNGSEVDVNLDLVVLESNKG